MPFHYRKLLPDKKTDDLPKKSETCYTCYTCPEDCSNYSSPPPLLPSDSPSRSEKHQISIFLILMLAVLGSALICLSYVAISRFWCRWRRRRRNPNPSPSENEEFREDFLEGPVVDHPIWYIRTVGLPQSVIDSISSFNYRKGDGLIEGRDCSVCLSEFEEDERLRLLPKCSHAFHLTCIDTWLRSHKNCPVCRAPVLITDTNPQTDPGTGLNRPGSGEENVGANEPEMNRSGLETGEMRRGVDLNLVENNNMSPVEDNDKLPEMIGHFDRRNGKFRVMSDLADRTVNIDRELQAIRRSISMDFGSVSTINQKKKDEGCLDTNVEIRNSDVMQRNGSVGLCTLMKSSSNGRSVLQIKGPVLMKKSFSFNGKRSFMKNGRSQDSIPITDPN